MSTSPQDFNARIIDEFRANDGRVGGPFEGSTLLLLHRARSNSKFTHIFRNTSHNSIIEIQSKRRNFAPRDETRRNRISRFSH